MKRVRALEMVWLVAAAEAVCMKTGLIRGVKLCGIESKNGYDYPDAVHQDAAERQLYVNTPIYKGHPNKRHKEGEEDRFGDLVGVVKTHEYRAGQGAFGDVQANLENEGGRALVFAAKHGIRNIGMSHEAIINKPESAEGSARPATDRIHEIAAMAVVDGPATTAGFYESFRDASRHYVIDSPAKADDQETPMKLDELKQKHPALYSQVVAEGLARGKADAVSADESKRLQAEADMAKQRADKAEADLATMRADQAFSIASEALAKKHDVPASVIDYLAPQLKAEGADQDAIVESFKVVSGGAKPDAKPTSGERPSIPPATTGATEGQRTIRTGAGDMPINPETDKAVRATSESCADFGASLSSGSFANEKAD